MGYDEFLTDRLTRLAAGKGNRAVIDCHKCRHYFVTWEKERPHGCRAIGFKSARLPAAEVRLSSGEECLYFELKETFRKK